MKKDDRISMLKLVENGWNYITTFSYFQVWGKGEQRIMWSPKEERVILAYKKDERYATGGL